MSLRHLLFGFSGRITRTQFWTLHLSWVTLLIAVKFTGAWLYIYFALIHAADLVDPIARRFLPGLPGFSTLSLVGLPLLWLFMAISIKRLHDRGKSGYWMLLLSQGTAGAAVARRRRPQERD